jgi:chemotaxis methyl-accepting protein methylase
MDYDPFLREAASLLGLQWREFRKRGVRRKVERRIVDIGLSGLEEYLSRIKQDRKEQVFLSQILTVTISRFFRDKEVFHALEASVIPTLLKEKKEENLNAWSIGCASGEEPYSLSLLWKGRFEKERPGIRFSILATDIGEYLIERAREGRYKKSSLEEIPEDIFRNLFKRDGESYLLDRIIRENVEFRRHDIIRDDPFTGMDMILCRNLAFTYFSKETQLEVLKKIAASLNEEGYLIIGKDESLPLTYPTLFVPVFPTEKIYRKFTR